MHRRRRMARHRRVGQARGDMAAKGGVAAAKGQDGPGTDGAQRLAHAWRRVQATLDAGQTDAHGADVVEVSAFDEFVDARTAEPQAPRGLAGRHADLWCSRRLVSLGPNSRQPASNSLPLGCSRQPG